MKVLIFSDSHAGLHFMRHCVKTLRPDAIVHLGDFYEDGQVVQQENFHLPFQQVPGNCDRYRCPFGAPEVVCCSFGGVRCFMTHGHNHRVKAGTGALIADARRAGAQLVLYGHTHQGDCRQLEDGMWILNPGACGSFGGSVGVVEIEAEKISACRILTQADLDTI